MIQRKIFSIALVSGLLVKKAIALSLVIVSVLLANILAFAESGSITVEAKRLGSRIPSSLYGIFFEEISHYRLRQFGQGGALPLQLKRYRKPL